MGFSASWYFQQFLSTWLVLQASYERHCMGALHNGEHQPRQEPFMKLFTGKHATQPMFITCSSVLLDLLVPGKIYCWNVKLGGSKPGIRPHVPPHRSPHEAGSGLRPCRPPLWPFPGPAVPHGAAPRLPPASRRPSGTFPGQFRPRLPEPWQVAGFQGLRVAHAGLGLPSIHQQACGEAGSAKGRT